MRALYPAREHSSAGIATRSAIRSPKPASAGMCIGIFESSRIRWIPKSDRIWPPSPVAGEFATGLIHLDIMLVAWTRRRLR